MSNFYGFKFKSNKRNKSNDNIFGSSIFESIEIPQKEKEIIGEIIKQKILIDIPNFEDECIDFINKRNHSVKKTREIEDLSDFGNVKMKFENWCNYNKEINSKIEEKILKLLEDIFDKRYILYPNNVCTLSSYCLQCKENIEEYFVEYYELSVYILYVLYKQINLLFKHIDKEINLISIKANQYENIKEILYYIGEDIEKIFQKVINITGRFKFSSILIVMMEEYLIKENKMGEKVYKKIKSPIYKEKEKFESFLKGINNLKFKKYYENLYEKINLDNKNDDNDLHEKNNIENIDNNENNIINENGIKNNNIDNINDNKGNENSNNNNEQNLNIEDLVNFINEPDNKSNKKKKKKKKGKKNEKNKNKNIKDSYIEEDMIFLDYKKSLEEYTKEASHTIKIRPKYSEAFLKSLEELSQ